MIHHHYHHHENLSGTHEDMACGMKILHIRFQLDFPHSDDNRNDSCYHRVHSHQSSKVVELYPYEESSLSKDQIYQRFHSVLVLALQSTLLVLHVGHDN